MSNIERRQDTRHPANVRTEIRYKGTVYHGVIENLSASGAGIVTDKLESEVDFVQYEPLELKFTAPSGKEFTVKCNIMWASYITAENLRYRIGLELVGRPWDAITQFTK